MPRFRAADTKSLTAAMTDYLDEFSGDMICARQIWYEALGGYGVPNQEDMDAMNAILSGLDGWKHTGEVRYEKFGKQDSYSRTENPPESERLMVMHKFKLNHLYKAPDGRVYKVVLSEVYNLKCFEIKDGKMTGPMITIKPTSEQAKALVLVSG